MRIILHILLAVSLVACSSAKKNFNQELASGRCDEAMKTLPERDPLVKLTDTTELAAGTVASYAFVGASYTAEVMWDIVGGTVMVVALCAPAIAVQGLAVASTDADHSRISCLPGSISALGAPPLGRQALKASKPLRCPDLKSLSRSLRAVASCYNQKDKKADWLKAQQTLQALKNSEDFYSCLPADEHEHIDVQFREIQAKLASDN